VYNPNYTKYNVVEVRYMSENSFNLKTRRIILLSTVIVFLLAFTTYAITDNIVKSSTFDNLSLDSSKNESNIIITGVSNYSSIIDSVSLTSKPNESAGYSNNSSESKSVYQADNSNEISTTSLKVSSKNEGFSKYSSSDGLDTNSGQLKTSAYNNSNNSVDSRSGGKGRQGFIWMDIEDMKSEISTLILNRFYDEIQSSTYSVPNYEFAVDKFYDIINITKKYDWTEHKSFVNAYQIKACEITVIGNNTVYTYLIFGRDEYSKCFVWSFYDYKIAYISEQDFEYIEDIFKNVG